MKKEEVRGSVEGTQTSCFLTSSSCNPKVGISTIFTATLLDADKQPVPNRPLKIFHYLDGGMYTDAVTTTNKAGIAKYKVTWTAAGMRPFGVSFDGDATYKASSSGLAVNVGKK